MKNTSGRLIEKWVGLAAGLSLITGIAALFGAVMGLFSGEAAAAGLYLIAAALAFGLFLTAVLRP